MFERQYIKARQTRTGYDFSGLLINLKSLLGDSTIVVANLESVFAGSECKYTASLYSFNTPTEALDVLKECNISVVTTANNHCLDRGIKGIQKTIQALDQRRILHTGTYIDPNETDRSLIREINGVRYAFMSYTYGTNSLENKILLNQSELGHINLLKPQENDKLAQTEKQPSAFREILNTLSQKLFSSEARMRIKKTLGMTLNVPIVDDNLKIDYNFLDKLRQDIKKTKSESDVQFMCLHCGGQFNAYPGNFTEEIVRVLHQEGIHYIIATHPHVVQLCSVDNCGNITFYSIGNLTISPSSIYVLHELKWPIEYYKHVITPLPFEEIDKRPDKEVLTAIRQSLANLEINGPNTIIANLPDGRMMTCCDSKKLRPVVVGGDENMVAISSEVCGINEILPNRDMSKDIYPNEREVVVITNDLEVQRWKQ